MTNSLGCKPYRGGFVALPDSTGDGEDTIQFPYRSSTSNSNNIEKCKNYCKSRSESHDSITCIHFHVGVE